MTSFWEGVFWVSAAAAAFVYVGYPLFLKLWTVLFERRVQKQAATPFFTILISAYNEEAHIRDTIQNKLDQDYPHDRLEIIVTSDGSTDGTEAIVRSFESQGVRLLVQSPRQGKTAALNRAVTEAKGDIIVFSDANSLYEKQVLRKIAANFSDPQVGYVTGKMVYVDEKGSLVGSGCSAYMRYENLLRSLETKAGSIIGVDGGIDAVRKSLYRPMRADLLPDFVLPLSVIEQGYRVVYEEDALLQEDALSDQSDEWKMRVRVILRAFHALWHMKGLFNPFRFPLISFQLFAHKLLRYWTAFFQITLLVSNAFLAGQSPFYGAVFVLQVIFYVLAGLGSLKVRIVGHIPLIKHAFYFCLLNAASLAAFFKFIRGQNQTVWTPRKG